VLPSRRVGGVKRGFPVASGRAEGRQGIVPSARAVAAGGAAVAGGWDGAGLAGPQAAPDSSNATARVSRQSLLLATSTPSTANDSDDPTAQEVHQPRRPVLGEGRDQQARVRDRTVVVQGSTQQVLRWGKAELVGRTYTIGAAIG
jgi:hypothetical protein